MTHQANYAHDRLALYTFETAIRFIQCWTNLKIKTISPLQLAEKYFRRFPEEKDPIWGVIIYEKVYFVNFFFFEKS